jgi:hypothetical protein
MNVEFFQGVFENYSNTNIQWGPSCFMRTETEADIAKLSPFAIVRKRLNAEELHRILFVVRTCLTKVYV